MDTLRRVAVIVFLVATLIFNALANILPFNGVTTGGVSDDIPSLFTPAGYVFSIWGVIYLALMLYAVYQALGAQRNNPRLRKTGWWFVVSCTANMVWLFCWHYLLFPLSMLAMLVLLASLIIIYNLLETGRTQVSLAEQFFARMPFSIYLGWISVATIANASVVLITLNWNGWGLPPQTWTAIVITIAALLGALMSWLRHDWVYGLVLVWAFAGIAVKQAANPFISGWAWGGLAFVLIAMVIGYIHKLRQPARVAL